MTLNEVREKFFDLYDCLGEKFDERDLDRIEQNDTFVNRFIQDNQSEKEAELVNAVVNQLVDCLRWRKANRINDLSPKDLPREHFEIAHCEFGHELATGKFISILRPISHRKLEAYNDLSLLSFVYIFETHFSDVSNALMVLDLTNATYNTVNLSMMSKVNEIITRFYPGLYAKFLNYGLHWMGIPFFNLLKKAAPKKLRDKVDFIYAIPEFKPISETARYPVPEGLSDFATLLRKQGESEKAIKQTYEFIDSLRKLYN